MGKTKSYKRNQRRLQKIRRRRKTLAEKLGGKSDSVEHNVSSDFSTQCTSLLQSASTSLDESPNFDLPLESESMSSSSSFGSPGSPPSSPFSSGISADEVDCSHTPSGPSLGLPSSLPLPSSDQRVDEGKNKTITDLQSRLRQANELIHSHKQEILRNEKIMQLMGAECRRRICAIRTFWKDQIYNECARPGKIVKRALQGNNEDEV